MGVSAKKTKSSGTKKKKGTVRVGGVGREGEARDMPFMPLIYPPAINLSLKCQQVM